MFLKLTHARGFYLRTTKLGGIENVGVREKNCAQDPQISRERLIISFSGFSGSHKPQEGDSNRLEFEWGKKRMFRESNRGSVGG